MDNKSEKEALEKLMELTKFIKKANIKIGPKASEKGGDKWRTKDPKFPSKQKPEEQTPPDESDETK